VELQQLLPCIPPALHQEVGAIPELRRHRRGEGRLAVSGVPEPDVQVSKPVPVLLW